eukprot:4724-Rhodomonas_salina.1
MAYGMVVRGGVLREGAAVRCQALMSVQRSVLRQGMVLRGGGAVEACSSATFGTEVGYGNRRGGTDLGYGGTRWGCCGSGRCQGSGGYASSQCPFLHAHMHTCTHAHMHTHTHTHTQTHMQTDVRGRGV